jgi:beta-lactamase class A
VLQRSQKMSARGRRQNLQRRESLELRQRRQKRQETQKVRLIAKHGRDEDVQGQRALSRVDSSVIATGSPRPVLDASRQNTTRVSRQQSRQADMRGSSRQYRKQGRRSHWIGYVLKLGSFGLGISAVVGTAIAILHPSPYPGTLASTMGKASQKIGMTDPTTGVMTENDAGLLGISATPVLDPAKELKEVKVKVQALAAAQADLVPGMFFYNPETGAYLDIAGDQPFSAASTIKLPVLIALFQTIDAGQASLEEQLVMRKDLIATESGAMQYQPPGTKYSALETAENMITVSDNTATNMLMDRLGGAAALNQRFKTWGLMGTVINNPLPDLEGTNTISPRDLSTLMLKISQGELLTPHSRDRVLNILRRTVTDTLLPQGLDKGATIAHKTGDIGSVVGDAGLIEMPNGQRYVATVMVKRPHNDPRAQELIRQISHITYQALNQNTPSSPAMAEDLKP